jgi:hypothetical protein
MRFENNFVLVAPNIMIDPALKVIFREGRFELDNAAHSFLIEYNPELRADKLRRAMSAEEIAEYNKHKIPRPRDDLVPNISENSYRILSLSVFETNTGALSCTRFRRHRVRCFMEQEVRHGEKAVYTGVQA